MLIALGLLSLAPLALSFLQVALLRFYMDLSSVCCVIYALLQVWENLHLSGLQLAVWHNFLETDGA